MPKFRKKPVTIEAIQWTGENLAEVLEFTGKHPNWGKWFDSFEEYEAHVNAHDKIFKIKTLEGTHEASPGDWIIKGVEGEFYPCKPRIFATTYDLVDDEVKHERDEDGTVWEAEESKEMSLFEAATAAPIGSRWQHLKTDHTYVVTGHCLLEATAKPAILYKHVDGDGLGRPMWARDAEQFLDGRFFRMPVDGADLEDEEPPVRYTKVDLAQGLDGQGNGAFDGARIAEDEIDNRQVAAYLVDKLGPIARDLGYYLRDRCGFGAVVEGEEVTLIGLAIEEADDV